MALYVHHRNYHGPWPWKNFSQREVSCRCCGQLYLDAPSLDAMQLLRDIWGKPIAINSGHRCAAHNKSVGGAPESMHLKLAFDCLCPREEQEAFVLAAKQCGFTGIGQYASKGFVHLDKGKARTWRG